MSKSAYTETLVKELQKFETLTYAEAVEFAATHGLKVRSVIAKAKSLEIVYVPKPVVTKTGEPVIRKDTIIRAIESAVSVEVSALDGLQKATKSALVALLKAVAAEAEETEENETA